MLLRPAKIFSPLHQLRHYLEAKVAELVQQQPSVTSALQNAKSQFYTVSHQHAIVKPHFHPKAPTLYHVAEREQQRLLKALQQQFPIVKVFSAPTIAKPYAYQFSFVNPQQCRTIVSSSSSSSSNMMAGHADGFYAAANGFYNSGGFFPRTVVGYARTPFAARQFSTAKSPCVTLFQQTTSTTNTGFSHISSRFFSPAGSKMSSPFPTGNESQARPSPMSSATNNDEKDQGNAGAKPMFSRQQENKGMSELIQEEQVYPSKRHQLGLVRRGSVSRRVSRKTKANTTPAPRFEYIRHDDLSCKYTPHRKGATVRHHWHSSRVKAPPDKKCVYLSFQLDGSALWNELPSKSQVLDRSLISTLNSVAELYQIYLTQVVMILTELQRHGKKFRAKLYGNELRIIFPSSEHWPEEDRQALAREWLVQVGIDPDSPYIVLKEMPLPEEQMRHLDAPVEDEALGPDYFKGIQAFLDHVDDLIETGPAFVRH
ncbi:hypothetical protein BJV82DRAFT_600642 [Fennellomyces sp. T-0311]|nr:hypothetical protein BJV82DRAFT_600642 [Fennellomyces sp. T-0311]